MKAKFEKTVVLDAIGVLDIDDNGEYALIVETKDDVKTYALSDILKEIAGTTVHIKSIADANV
jgi:hypothetical protein